ncbi:MAG: metallophosphoesterase [Chloroflexi bacterium]|nr:metallophosphoesterase [Chloroflexota bacterium]
MEFVHLSDLHLLASPAACQHGINPWQRVEWALATIAAFETRPAFSIITGDLVDHADDASYRLVQRAIAALDAIAGPVFVALGNHDARARFRRVVCGAAARQRQPWHASATVNGVQIITLDSSVPGHAYGRIDAAQLAWLADELARPAPGGRIIAMHHPPPPCPLTLLGDGFVLRDAEHLAAVIAGRGVMALLAGHIHQASTSLFAGVPAITAPGLAYTIEASSRRVLRATAGSGLLVGHIRQGRTVMGVVMHPGPSHALFSETAP